MYWTGKNGPRFIRPIRWIVALLGDEVVPFEIAGREIRATSPSGHRILGAARIPVTIENYEAEAARELRDSLGRRAAQEDPNRRLRISHASEPDAALLEDAGLPDRVSRPRSAAAFDPQFLELPEGSADHGDEASSEIFLGRRHETAMLAPQFVAVMNTSGDPEGLVRRGNERVLRARFNDAPVFLGDRSEQEARGPRRRIWPTSPFRPSWARYLAKTERVVELVQQIGGDEHAAACRAASPSPISRPNWSKNSPNCRASSADSTRARKVSRKRLAGDLRSLQAGQHGRCDSARALRATGFARRQARHAARMFPHRHDPDRIARSVRAASRRAGRGQDPGRSEDSNSSFDLLVTMSRLREFVARSRSLLLPGSRGVPVRRSQRGDGCRLETTWSMWKAACSRVQAVRPTENFEPLAASFKRIQNILRQAEFAGGVALDAGSLEPGPEDESARGFRTVRRKPRPATGALETHRVPAAESRFVFRQESW